MMDEEAIEGVSEAVRRAFERLRREYLDEMPARLAALRAAASAGDTDELRMQLHQLSGSGGSHGFPAISAAARDLEHTLPARGAPLDEAAVSRGLDRLTEAIAAARDQ